MIGDDLDSPLPRLGFGLVSVTMISSLLVAACTTPERKNGVQLHGVKRRRVRTVRITREPAETSGAIEEPGARQTATRLADGERRDKRTVRRCVLVHQTLQDFRHLMDRMRWQYLKRVHQLLIGDEDSALRYAFEKCTHPYMHKPSIELLPVPWTRC